MCVYPAAPRSCLSTKPAQRVKARQPSALREASGSKRVFTRRQRAYPRRHSHSRVNISTLPLRRRANTLVRAVDHALPTRQPDQKPPGGSRCATRSHTRHRRHRLPDTLSLPFGAFFAPPDRCARSIQPFVGLPWITPDLRALPTAFDNGLDVDKPRIIVSGPLRFLRFAVP